MAEEHHLRASIVVPARNRTDLLERTLKTLIAQDLPHSDYEVIVCDDGSAEDIETVVLRHSPGSLRVSLKRQAPLGPASARNMGVRASRAAVVIFIDSDVVVDASLVRQLLAAMDSHPEWCGAEAALHPLGEKSGILWDAPASREGGHYHTAAIAYRRETLFSVGGFDEQFSLPACEDVEIALRVLEHGPIGFVPDAIVWHPTRKVTAMTHWRWRRHWRYETILAVRYGVLAFPGQPCGPLPRVRVAWSALVTLPGGRLLAALKSLLSAPWDAALAALFAMFDVLCGFFALPTILFVPVPMRESYLSSSHCNSCERMHT